MSQCSFLRNGAVFVYVFLFIKAAQSGEITEMIDLRIFSPVPGRNFLLFRCRQINRGKPN